MASIWLPGWFLFQSQRTEAGKREERGSTNDYIYREDQRGRYPTSNERTNCSVPESDGICGCEWNPDQNEIFTAS